MYGSDAGQPPRSLYTKGLSPLCDIDVMLGSCFDGTSTMMESHMTEVCATQSHELCTIEDILSIHQSRDGHFTLELVF